MSTAAISAISLPLDDRRASLRILIAIGIIQILSGILSIHFGWGFAFAPAVALGATVVLLWPRAGVYAVVTLAYLRVALPGLDGVYPADIASLIVIAGVAMGRLIRGESLLVSTRLNRVLAAILIVFAFSLLVAHNLHAGAVNWFRHLQLFWLMITIVGCIDEADIRRLVRWALFLTAIISVWNVVTFVVVAGERRVFGPTGPFFPTFLAAAICQSAVAFLFGTRSGSRFGWAGLWLLYMAALVCSQTREVMLQVVFALLLLFYLTWRWSSKHGDGGLRRRTVILAIAMSLIGLILVTGSLSVLQSPSQRVVQAVEGRAPTVDYRLFLWKTGLKVFADSPLLGIGLGQIRTWDEILPFWRLDPLSMATKGLGAHNDFITYIAETGLLGMSCILVLFGLMFRLGSAMLRRSQTAEAAGEVLMMWLPVCAILMRFFFGTHMFYSVSGILTSFYFALLIKYGQCEQITQTTAMEHR